MNLKRIAVAGLATAGVLMGGAALAGSASADTNTYAPTTKTYWPVLQYGQVSENVRAMQWILNCNGDKVDPTSRFGPNTLKAVKSYQYKNGNAVDGIVGASTWTSMTAKGGPIYGEKNDCNKALQVALNKWRYNDDLPISGLFGPRTKAKLIKFQYAHGLTADGVPTEVTWNKLIATPAGK